MSLTSMLGRRGEPLRELFEAKLPECRGLQKEWLACGPPTIVPTTPVSWGLVGAAVDYRLRYLFVVTPPQKFVASHGSVVRKLGPSFAELANSLTEFLAAHDPRGRALDSDAETQLARYCYLLALYESLFRANVVNSPLFGLAEGSSADVQLTLAPEGDTSDIVTLTSHAVSTFKDSFAKPFIANPTFAGSIDVGGADADFILDGCLIDIKTTTSKSLSREAIYQILGYVILDYDNRYNIDSVGFYLSRVPALIRWPVVDTISAVSAGKETLESLRGAVRELLQGM